MTSIEETIQMPEHIKIDIAHANLLTSLICCNKPKSILELGLGGGRSADAIMKGIQYNQNNPTYTLVDNWLDYNYVQPQNFVNTFGGKINIITSDEKSFVYSCTEKYDFILSDADHQHTNEWFEYVFDNLLNNDGILIYHDVSFLPGHYQNLLEIYYKCIERNIKFKLFNKNSLPNEKCERGLMVIFK
jgi:predicted O-methyltransferase YrrM